MPRKSAHRAPPKPRFYHTRNPGHCRFCGKPIRDDKGRLRTRATWHPACALTWAIMTSPQEARLFVFVRDRGVCSGCGKDCFGGTEEQRRQTVEAIMTRPPGSGPLRLPLGRWELDHVEPLSTESRDPRKWQLGNMSSLCKDCHAAKTKKDRIIQEALRCDPRLQKFATSLSALDPRARREALITKLITIGFEGLEPQTHDL